MSNYHEVLDASRDASPEEIRKAYRKKARQLHPDVTDPGHEDEFKEISSAYEVLFGADKHQMYDLGGEDAVRGGGGFGGGFIGADFGDLGDIFQSFFGGEAASRGPVSRTRRGQNAPVAVDVELSDIAFGATRLVPVDAYVTCTACDGSCYAPDIEPVACSRYSGVGNIQRMTRTLPGQVMTSSPCPSCQSYDTVIVTPRKDCSGEDRARARQDLEISIPAGVPTGTHIRMSGRGEASPTGGPNGDLYLGIHEKPHKFLERNGDDLCTELCVPMIATALGAILPLQTLDGEQNVTIKAGSQPGDEIVFDDPGVERLRRKGHGDLHVSIAVGTPARLDDRQRELLAELTRLRGEDDVEPVRDSNIMGKLKERFSGR